MITSLSKIRSLRRNRIGIHLNTEDILFLSCQDSAGSIENPVWSCLKDFCEGYPIFFIKTLIN